MTSFRILPLLIIVAFLALSVRLGEVWTQSGNLSGSVMAQNEDDAAEEILSEEDLSEDMVPLDEMAQADISRPELSSEGDDLDMEYSEARQDLYDSLAERRRQLDARERDISRREALLRATEEQIDLKAAELARLKTEIQDLLGQQEEAEAARIGSLVKIYEGMKAKDAARIFNTLDMDILLEVVSQMSERKSAPILAAMEAERARNLTQLLAEQKALPDISEDDLQLP